MKALFVGLGAIGQRHLRNLRRLRGDAIDIMAWRARGLTHVVTDQLAIERDMDLAATLWSPPGANFEGRACRKAHCYFRLQPIQPSRPGRICRPSSRKPCFRGKAIVEQHGGC